MNILFICHANICRSYMAQELLKPFLSHSCVYSRGLYADAAYVVPVKVTSFLNQCGISTARHISTQLTPKDMTEADIIFFMEQKHLEKLSDRYAQYLGKMWLLTDFAFGKEEDIPDPIGLSGRAFEKAARTLQKAVLAAGEKLRKDG